MSKIILSHPYSGALYAYIADQMNPVSSHTGAVGNHPYYTTLYGKNYKTYTDQALMFTLIYDDVYLTPADNPWPKSKISESYDFHPELGLHANWADYSSLFNNNHGFVSQYLADSEIMHLLGEKFKIPKAQWNMVMSSILYEYDLSRKLRCAIICSPGRKAILNRVVEIDRPAIYPKSLDDARIEAVDNYINVTGLLLSPTSLDNMLFIKPNKDIRAYGSSFLTMLTEFQSHPTIDAKRNLILLARNAVEQESIWNNVTGILNWLGTLLRIVGIPHLAIVPTVASEISKYQADQASWYEFAGEIRRIETKANLVRQLDQISEELVD